LSRKNWIIFILLGSIWGSSFLWIKVAVQEIGPVTLVAFRTSFALLGLGILMLVRKEAFPIRQYWKVFLVLGFFNIALPFMLIAWSEQYISSGLASVLNSTMPLFTIVIAPMFVMDDPITLPKTIGLLVGFGGVVVLMSTRMGIGLGAYQFGIVAMLAASLSYASSTVFARRRTKGLSPISQAFGQMVAAWMFMVPIANIVEAPFTFPQKGITWLGLAWLGLLGTCVATSLYYYLLHTIGPTRMSLANYLMTLIAVILGIVILREKPDWQLIVGGLMIISGVIIVNSHLMSRRPHGTEQPSA
jgi:drug/metabolite transporter (DMT)-like permease